MKLSGINAETKQRMEFDLADVTYTDESIDDSRLTWIMPGNHEPIPILYVTIKPEDHETILVAELRGSPCADCGCDLDMSMTNVVDVNDGYITVVCNECLKKREGK